MRKLFTLLTAGLFVMLGATAAEQLDIRKITNGAYSA